MSKKCVIGIDLGGTKILTAAANLKGKIISKVRVDTDAEQGLSKVIGNIVKSVVVVLSKGKLDVMGEVDRLS